MSEASAADRLLAALTATLRGLEASDVAAAASGATAVASACAELEQGPALAPETLAEARALQARCEALAAQRQEHVVAELLQSASQRKAAHAYRSTT